MKETQKLKTLVGKKVLNFLNFSFICLWDDTRINGWNSVLSRGDGEVDFVAEGHKAVATSRPGLPDCLQMKARYGKDT